MTMRAFHGSLMFATLLPALVAACGPNHSKSSSSSEAGASGDSGDSGGSGDSGASVLESDSAVGCVISADCPAGAHCDLGECIQECNDMNPCADGLTCSARARCLPTSTPDADPAPITVSSGTITADPPTTLLTDQNQTLKITLKSTSKQPVDYRIQVDAPHLSVKTLRGQFTRSTTIAFDVDPSKLQGQGDVPGSVKFFTSLGNVTVNAPIHTGISGSYRGSLRYDGGLVNLGDARFVLNVAEKNGEVTVRFDPDASLLFPATKAGPATGFGNYAPGQPIELNGSQIFEETFGGTRNHFQRAIGRRIKLILQPTDSGDLSGTFEDNVYGLFQEPIKLTGSVTLQYEPHADPVDFSLTPDAVMPTGGSGSPSPTIFGWADNSCADTLDSACTAGYASVDTSAHHAACFAEMEQTYSQPLYDAMAGDSVDFDGLATACTSATGASNTRHNTDCGLLAPIACALSESAAGAHDATNGGEFNHLMQEALAPGLLIAQNEVVQALKDSFGSGGALAELQRYDSAVSALDPVAEWVFSPDVVEYLRNMDPKIAEGASHTPATETQNDSYPGARALGRLLTVMTTVDGERARVSGVATPTQQPTLVTKAQARAVLSYFETATLVATLDQWQVAPPNIAADFTGVLNPLDSGFAALLSGAGAFGVPDTFVPFVFNPQDITKGTTNFQQMVQIASEAVTAYTALENEYTMNGRTFEQNENTLRQEALQVQTTYESQISDICGTSFDINKVSGPSDWQACGANNEGQVGDLLLQIGEAQAELQSSLSRIQGMKDKIAIDRRVLAQTQNVHEDTLNFIDQTGQELDAITWSQGVIEAEQAALQTAAQSSLWDGGAAAGMAVGTLALGVAKTALDVRRQDVQTAQSMHAEQASAQIELINGMGNIQKETIDLAQLAVEMQQSVIAVEDAQAKALNAVQQAQRVFDERTQALAVNDLSPAHDPSYRLLRDQESLNLLSSRARAQQLLFLAGQALQYEVNDSISSMGGAVLNARNALSMGQFTSCLKQIADSFQTAYGSPQTYSTTVSVRAMLGITGPRTDAVTGEKLSEGQQFRQILLQNQNLDGKGGVGISFATDLQPGNQLWSTDVCSDRITSVQAQLVGDFQGDNEAQVNLSLSGAALLRDCGSDDISTWSFGSQSGNSDALAVVQAGVNSFGTAPENASLYGQSVARASWQITVPGAASAPSNSDVDLTQLDDIVLQIKHGAIPQRNSPLATDLSCLANIK
jgi:hypothetical protein